MPHLVSNLGIDTTFTSEISDFEHTNNWELMTLSVVSVVDTSTVDAFANPCISIRFYLLDPNQRGLSNQLSSFKQLL